MRPGLGPLPVRQATWPTRERMCVDAESIPLTARLSIGTPVTWSDLHGTGQSIDVAVRERVREHLAARMGGDLVTTCGASDLRLRFDAYRLYVGSAAGGVDLGGTLRASVRRGEGAPVHLEAKRDAADLPSGPGLLLGFAVGELTSRLVDDLLEQLGLEMPPPGFDGTIFWAGWHPGPWPSTCARPATPARVAPGRFVTRLKVYAPRHTHAELPAVSGLHERLGRAGAALGATHFVVTREELGTTATSLWDFPRSTTLVEADVDFYRDDAAC